MGGILDEGVRDGSHHQSGAEMTPWGDLAPSRRQAVEVFWRGIFLAGFLCWCSGIYALDPGRHIDQYSLHAWSVQDGLPQSTVNDIVQSRRGFVYIATFGGVVRFDGVNMTSLPADSACGGRYVALAVDHEDRIWAAGERARLCRIENDRIVVPELPGGVALDSVTQLFVDDQNILWAIEMNRLLRISPTSVDEITLDQHWRGEPLHAVAQDAAGRIWLGGDSGLCQVRDQYCEPAEWLQSLNGAKVTALVGSDDGSLWIGSESVVFRANHGIVRTIDLPVGQGWVRELLIDGSGNTWAGLRRGGLIRVGDSPEQPLEGSPLRASGVESLMYDREGNLWIGFVGDGLRKLANGRAWGKRLPDIDLHQPFVTVTADPNGDIWAGLPCWGLVHFRADGHRLFGEEDGLTNLCVWSVLPDAHGQAWIGTYSGGLFFLDRNERITRLEGLATTAGIVRAVVEDVDGTVLIGTDDGAFRHHKHSSIFERLPGTEGRDVNYISRGPSGALWLGTRSGLLQIKNGQMQSFGEAQGLPAKLVRAILEEDHGTVWIGTHGGGLVRMIEGRMTVIDQASGLPDSIVSSIFVDDSGDFWMSGNLGVTRVSRDQLAAYADGEISRVEARLFDHNDGMPTSETNGGAQPAGVLLDNGYLLVPTVNGLAILDTGSDLFNPLPPPVLIEQVLVDGQRLDHHEPIVLDSGARNLEIRYTALSFRSPERVRFRYRLEGFDDRWVEADTRRETRFPAIPSGSLRFHVQAANEDGIWNDTGAEIRLEVRPGLMQQPAFFAALGGLAILLGIASARLRTSVIERRQQQLEKEVQRRTTELAQLAELTEHINRALKLEQIFDHTFEMLRGVIPYQLMVFALTDTESSRLGALWSRQIGENSAHIARKQWQPFDETWQKLLESGKPRIVADPRAFLKRHSGLDQAERLIDDHIRSAMLCPLGAGDEATGLLILASSRPQTYDDAHIDFLRQLGGQLALAIAKSRNYEQLFLAKRELESRNRELTSQATIDYLTGIPNRRAFHLNLERMWQEAVAGRSLLSALIIDVDHFKSFNDELGHQAGDDCLCEVANVIAETVGDGPGAVARIGGEEFAVLLPDSDADRIAQIGRQLCQAVAGRQIPHPGSPVGKVTISVGCATVLPQPKQNPSALMEKADQALYSAKRAGRNQVVFGRRA